MNDQQRGRLINKMFKKEGDGYAKRKTKNIS